LTGGQSISLTAELTPSTSAQIPDTSITWVSTNPEVAEVNEDGEVTAKKGGNTMIRAVNYESTYGEVEVVVPVESMSVNTDVTTLKVGKTISLAATVEPSDSLVSYRSTDPSIAKVNDNGEVSAIRSGQVQIVVSCGQFSQSIDLEVRLDSVGESDLLSPEKNGNTAFSVQKPSVDSVKYVFIGISAAIIAVSVVAVVLVIVLKSKKVA
ncbi:MAG: Ig-like domain-containing protein, partial [Clostridia bacterium]|nr:Ig-like domain-containing protein [Clostridia bacterium]